jgi:hypothetical protein
MRTFLAFLSRRNVVVLAVLSAVVGAVTTFLIMRTSWGDITPQDSLSILMSNDIAAGKPMLMRYGQPSSGAIEQYIGAPFALLFDGSPLVVIFPRVLLFIATLFVLLKTFLNTPSKREMIFVASGLMVTLPLGMFASLTFTGSSFVALLGCALAFIAAYYSAHSLRNTRYFYLWAFVCGVSLWASIGSLLFIVPTAIWIMYCAKPLRKKWFFALVVFVVGSLPWWIFNALNGFVSLRSRTLDGTFPLDDVRLGQNFDIFQALGLSPALSDSWSSEWGARIFVALAVASSVTITALFLKGSKNIFQKKSFSNFASLMLVIAGVAIAIDLSLRVFGFSVAIASLAFLTIAFIFVSVSDLAPKFVFIAIASLAMVATSFAVNVSPVFESQESVREALAQELQDRNIDTTLAPYEIAYPMTADLIDVTVAVPFDGGFYDKDRQQDVDASTSAIIIERSSIEQTWMMFCIQGYFEQAFERVTVDSYDVFLVPEKLQREISDVREPCWVNASRASQLR